MRDERRVNVHGSDVGQRPRCCERRAAVHHPISGTKFGNIDVALRDVHVTTTAGGCSCCTALVERDSGELELIAWRPAPSASTVPLPVQEAA
jgi:hypothetical protein